MFLPQGNEGVANVVTTMNDYDLQRDDWESLTELAHYSGHPEIASKIPSQVGMVKMTGIMLTLFMGPTNQDTQQAH